MVAFDAIDGCLLGLAVGDALGLPRESLSARRAERIFGGPPYRMCLVGRWSTTSDDTEHACITAQSLIACSNDVNVFARELARRLRWWFAALPCDAGWATIKSCARLWLGWSPSRSGVLSAGNGAAMRAPILGAYFWDQPERLVEFVDASTRITHRDPRALDGARLIARSAAIAIRSRRESISPIAVLSELHAACHTAELAEALAHVEETLLADAPITELAHRLGCGDRVNGYICHTAAVVIFAWLRYPRDYRGAVEAVIRLGGDTDTHAALAGALCGIAGDAALIPEEWLRATLTWPRSLSAMRQLSADLAATEHESVRPQHIRLLKMAIRNLMLLGIVLAHGFRRLLPPY